VPPIVNEPVVTLPDAVNRLPEATTEVPRGPEVGERVKVGLEVVMVNTPVAVLAPASPESDATLAVIVRVPAVRVRAPTVAGTETTMFWKPPAVSVPRAMPVTAALTPA